MADAAPPEEPQADGQVVEEEPEIPPCKAEIFIIFFPKSYFIDEHFLLRC